MNSPLDRIHAREEGRLSPTELELLERELASDPELARLADEYRLVHRLTSAGGPEAHARTRFEELERRLERSLERSPWSAWRRVAAAALVVGVAAAAFYAGRATRVTPQPLELTAIELDPRSFATVPADLPGTWADYDPRGEHSVRFLSDLDEAEDLARAAHRPLLVYGTYPGCPLAAALDAKVFSDPNVIALAERTVPIRVNLAELTDEEQLSYTRRGYPFLEMWRDDGRTTHSLTRRADPQIFAESLHDGLEKSDATGEQPAWDTLRSWSHRFVDARTAELEGDFARAERGFRDLVDASDGPAFVARRAEAGLARLSAGARELLLEARSTAARDVDQALRLLDQACERYTGTSFETDLRAARERLRRDGSFPELVERDRTA